ncbi:hypothetical protein [Bifidobacterium samirii]|uniref:Uncharacterized protein n=1 Tax=Bifidobacterium samirii TaxID=2306974 RepID=A0A430FJR6_9BIFI|nr:hypothetical protein [Bifidobacterium samirii]RSX53001.1 hypothetical protein D2E24_1672 [Bifidobacterium samirii]
MHTPEPRRRCRYPYTTCLLLAVSVLACGVWLVTHDACMHPVGNTLAALWGAVCAPLLILHILG